MSRAIRVRGLPQRLARSRRLFPAARVRGFSLVELMVAMTISLVLFAGALAIYFTSRATYTDNDRIARLQETGRIALDLLVRDARGAGWVGCVRNTLFANDLATPNDMRWDFSRAIQGYDGNGASIDAAAGTTGRPGYSAAPLTVNPGSITPDPASDVLVLRGPAREGAPWELADTMADFNSPLEIEPAPAGMAPGMTPGLDNSVMLATDCRFTSVFRMTNAGGVGTTTIQHAGGVGTPANGSAALSFAFQPRGVVMPLRSVVYWVAPTPGSPDATARSLFRRINDLPAEELLPGVQSMQLLFGEDTPRDGRVDAYRNARAVTDWNNVVAVQVSLLVRTPDEAGTFTDTQTYTLLDAPGLGPFGDRHQRMVFSSTISLRNLIL